MEPPPRYVRQRNGARHCSSLRSAAFRALLGFPPEEPNHNPGGSPVVVLMNISAKRGPVVVDIEQTYLEVSRRLDIEPAAYLIRNTVDRSRVPSGAADRNVRAGSANQAFNNRGYPPSISHPAETPCPLIISITPLLTP